MRFSVAAQQSVGARKRQEDAVRIVELQGDGAVLCLLSDGMGGHMGGDVASATAIEKFATVFSAARGTIKHRLKRSLEAANDAIAEAAAHDSNLAGMGATFIGAYFAGDDVHWISVGDSHLYHCGDSELEKLNEDHSMAPVLDSMAAQGRITVQEAMDDPQRNALRSALSGSDIDLIDHGQVKAARGAYILASDGLDTLSQSEITSLTRNEGDTNAEALAQALLQSVDEKRRERQDNTSLIVVFTDPQNKKKRFFGLF